MMSIKHIENFTVRTSEINHLQKIHPYALIQLMQEASMQHTIQMKVSMWDLLAIKSSWVLLKMDVNFYNLPSLNQSVSIHTYPTEKIRYFAFRDYLVWDDQNQLCASASSQWTLMHTEGRKMISVPDEFSKLIYDTSSSLPKPDFKLSSFMSPDDTAIINVNYHHLDWNSHVNNVVMFRLIMESIDTGIFYNKSLKRLLIQFKAEAMLGQSLLFEHKYVDDNKILHSVKCASEGKEIVLAETYWEKL